MFNINDDCGLSNFVICNEGHIVVEKYGELVRYVEQRNSQKLQVNSIENDFCTVVNSFVYEVYCDYIYTKILNSME